MYSKWLRAHQRDYAFYLTDIDDVRLTPTGSIAAIVEQRTGLWTRTGKSSLLAVERFAERIGVPFELVDRLVGPEDTQQRLWLAYEGDTHEPLAVYWMLGNSWPTDDRLWSDPLGDISTASRLFIAILDRCTPNGVMVNQVTVDESGAPTRAGRKFLRFINRGAVEGFCAEIEQSVYRSRVDLYALAFSESFGISVGTARTVLGYMVNEL